MAGASRTGNLERLQTEPSTTASAVDTLETLSEGDTRNLPWLPLGGSPEIDIHVDLLNSYFATDSTDRIYIYSLFFKSSILQFGSGTNDEAEMDQIEICKSSYRRNLTKFDELNFFLSFFSFPSELSLYFKLDIK